MRRHSFSSDSARRALGMTGIVGFVALALCSNANVFTRFHIMNTAKAEDSLSGTLQRGFYPSLGDEGAMPDLDGAIGWLNSAPLSRKSLRGKVVLVNFWTYTCINSLRPLPYVKTWAEKYKDAGFVVIGAHTPEFSFKHEPMNVENAVRTLSVTFPVAMDSNYRIWQSFNNQAWPAQAAGASLILRMESRATRPCTRPAFPATCPRKIVTTSSPVTDLNTLRCDR
jgi:thiol-disulfide isomerase/thioredoxin